MQNMPKKIIQIIKKASKEQSATISSQDRGFNYGDGFFTTAKVQDGQVVHWPLHRMRLIECAMRLGFSELDFVQLESEITDYIATTALGVLKIVVTRGSGGRGYGLPELPQSLIILSQLPFPASYPLLAQQGIKLAISTVQLASQPLFAGLKTLNRLEQVMIKQAMAHQTCDDVIVLDYNNFVIETSAANIVAINKGCVFSPNLKNCGIRGVYLQSLCDKLPVQFIDMTLEELQQMEAVFICNSLMGIVPVTAINNIKYELSTSVALLEDLLLKESAC